MLALVAERRPGEGPQVSGERRVSEGLLVEGDLRVLELEHELQYLGILRLRRRRDCVAQSEQPAHERYRRDRAEDGCADQSAA